MATNAWAPEPGITTADKIVMAAYLRGQGLDWETIKKRLHVRNVSSLIAAVFAHGFPPTPVPPGSFEVRCVLSAPRYHDLKAQLQQAGYGLENGLAEFVEQTAKDRRVRKAIEGAIDAKPQP